jgi:hypothetical protein
LEQAADWLENHKWHQHGYAPKDWYPGSRPQPTACCVVGALATANSLTLEDDGLVWATRALAAHLGIAPEEDPDLPFDTLELWERVLVNVASWNDASDRTKEEVILELRAAARGLHTQAACQTTR